MKNVFIGIMLCAGLIESDLLKAQMQMPRREERIYSLSLIWKELSYNFAFPETLKQVNLDSLYKAYLPKVEQVKTNYEYYRTLCAFMAHFNDAHTRAYVSSRPDDLPPLKTLNYGEKIIVSNVARNRVSEIPVGSEILRVEHIPVVQYIKDSVYPYIGASTVHWKFDKAVTEMWYGEPQSVLHLAIKTPKGEEREVEMVRNYIANGCEEPMVNTDQIPPIQIKIMNGKIGYIQVNSWENQYVDTIRSVFTGYLPQLRKCKGLIIDVRRNRGGTDEAYECMMDHLIADSVIQDKGKFLSRKHVASYKKMGEYDPGFKDYYTETAMEEIKYPPRVNTLDNSLKLHQPLIVISGHYTGSASEFFLLEMRENHRATLLGSPSLGALGELTFVPLPGDYGIMMCIKKYVNPDGSQFDETGVLPDIPVESDYHAYLQGRDNVLERAIKELEKQIITEVR